MAKWQEETYQLPKDLKWPVRRGYKTFVADRGTVRFDIPDGWVIEPGDNSNQFLDQPSPDDACTLEMSIFHLQPGPDRTKLPLVQLLTNVTKDSSFEVLSRREPVCQRRGLIQPLFTFAFWPEDARRVLPAWNELLRSLRLGEYVAFPIQLDHN